MVVRCMASCPCHERYSEERDELSHYREIEICIELFLGQRLGAKYGEGASRNCDTAVVYSEVIGGDMKKN